MSRVIVKQLPKNITEDKLRSLFGSKGTITDIQLKYTPDGKFRQFGFIGYRSEEHAQAAIKFFNNSCIQTSRIKVEACAALGAEEKPQAWSKYAKDNKKSVSERAAEEKKLAKEEKKKQKQEKAKSNKIEEIIGAHKDDPEFEEFMKVHDHNRLLWANDAAEVMTKTSENIEQITQITGEKEKAFNSAVEDEDESDERTEEDETNVESLTDNATSKQDGHITPNDKKTKVKSKDGVDLFTIKIHNVPYKTKRQEILKFFKPLKPYSVRLPTQVHGFCYVGFKTQQEMTKAMLKNKSFIKGKQVFFADFTEKNKVSKAKSSGTNTNDGDKTSKLSATLPAKWVHQQEALSKEEDISESGKIFFRNLAYTITEDELQVLFEKFGPVAEIHLPVDTITRQIKGFGTVTFVLPEHAVQAFNKLDGSDFHGRLLHLIPGKSRETEEETRMDDAGLSFKQKKALKLKQTAQQPVSWNTLFLGANAVAELLAKQYETSKEQILDTSKGGSNAAVRLALGETQLVIEMKKFLEEHGVHLAAFDTPNTGKRSKTIILAKNLPAETSVADITPLFAKFGPIGRIVLPPSGVTALIEFCEPSEAKHAFKKLAYTRFKNVPLFLEWAPEQSFKTTLNGEAIIPKHEEVETSATQTPDEVEKTKDEEPKQEEEDLDDLSNEPPEANTTLFLRNLNFKTVQDTVHNHFKSLGPIHSVEIAKRKDPDNPRQMNSLGYGFIQFKLASAADKALKQMQFTQIDGNQVELKRSDRTLKNPIVSTQRKPVKATKQTGSKILIRNIPFQAKIHEVREIFKAFGELRSLRLPMKAAPGQSSHRGFGFVDFVTKADAKKAYEALSQSTHLYGRRLVLEWASVDEEDVDELRKRTALQFAVSDSASDAKRSRKSVFDTSNIVEPSDEMDE